jgi:hypothetical protein
MSLNFARVKRGSDTRIHRLKNLSERAVGEKLIGEGWTVLKRGWPDFLAVKDDALRFIEVKGHKGAHLSPAQQLVAELLKDHFGIVVELLVPDVEIPTVGSRHFGTNPKTLGTNARAVGENPRALGRNPRALGTNPRAWKAKQQAKMQPD